MPIEDWLEAKYQITRNSLTPDQNMREENKDPELKRVKAAITKILEDYYNENSNSRLYDKTRKKFKFDHNGSDTYYSSYDVKRKELLYEDDSGYELIRDIWDALATSSVKEPFWPRPKETPTWNLVYTGLVNMFKEIFFDDIYTGL
jgi:hypothetical protein